MRWTRSIIKRINRKAMTRAMMSMRRRRTTRTTRRTTRRMRRTARMRMDSARNIRRTMGIIWAMARLGGGT